MNRGPASGGLDGDEPRRILYVINDVGVGGAQRVLLRQAAGLDRARFAPQVASLELAPGALHEAFEAQGIPVHALRRHGDPPASVLWRLPALLASLAPSIVHTHLAAAGVAGRWAARRAGVSMVVSTQHNLTDWDEKRAHPLRWLDRFTLPQADAVVAVSEAVRRAVARALPALEPRLHVVPNGVPVHELAGARAECRRRRAEHGVPTEAFVVGAVARLDRRKGLDTLIEAAALAAPGLPRLRVVIVGDGPERGALVTRSRTLGVDGCVRFVPATSRVRDWLATFDVFAAPSRTEGLGIAAIEALAAGVPVLASRVGGLPEVVEDGACGRLLPPDAPAAWAQAIGRCANGSEPLARWASGAVRQAERFSVAAGNAALERVYDASLVGAVGWAAA